MIDYRMKAICFSGALWVNGCCPECGNRKEKHMVGCKKTYEELDKIGLRKVEEVFKKAFE